MAKYIWAEENNDYRQFKQPIEIKNVEDLNEMADQEKEMFAEKIKVELFELRCREEMYCERRKELLEIENALRFLIERMGEGEDSDQYA